MYNLIDTDNYPWIALIQKKDWKHDDCQASYKEHLFSVSHTETKNMWIMTSKLPVAFRTLVCSCLFNLTQYFLLSLGTCLSTRSHHSLKTAGFRLITASGLRKSYHLVLIITNTHKRSPDFLDISDEAALLLASAWESEKETFFLSESDIHP